MVGVYSGLPLITGAWLNSWGGDAMTPVFVRFCGGEKRSLESTCSWITVFHKLRWSFLKLFHSFAMWFFLFILNIGCQVAMHIKAILCSSSIILKSLPIHIRLKRLQGELRPCGLAYSFSFGEEWIGNTFMEFVVHKLIYNRLEPRSKKRVIEISNEDKYNTTTIATLLLVVWSWRIKEKSRNHQKLTKHRPKIFLTW